MPIVPVLDSGYVRLVDWMGGDLSIVRAARCSYDAAWRTGASEGSDRRLIQYLMSHSHSTPFEAVGMTFEVKAPIFVFRQWHRHRTWSYNEVSARYTELPEEFYAPNVEAIGLQSKTNKQGRDVNVTLSEHTAEQRQHEIELYRTTCSAAFDRYRQLLEAGWPRELARGVLPVATYSKMFGTVNLWNLLKFAVLRSDSHAQPEIKVYSDAMIGLVQDYVAPEAIRAWKFHCYVERKDDGI